ncbi:VanW family protein [Paenibacillus guangzhouensis]|uniref:VanW family protein n=1 Tax=Paenibacillus guangzhouensis TaxID=1473112 RepID=UPI00126713A2|nr:VanW family protein [Paenibacillus guangzhouensis]
MKRIHIGFIVVAFIALVGVGTWGWLHSYASQSTLPKGVTLANWDIGNMKMTEVVAAYHQQIERLNAKKILLHINAPKPVEKVVTMKQLGVTFEESGLIQEMKKLTEGNLWDRVKYRYTMPKQWNLVVKWDDTALLKQFDAAWEKKYMGESVNAVRIISPQDEISYMPDQSAYRIDWARTKQDIEKWIPREFLGEKDAEQTAKVEFSLKEMPAKITLDALKAEGVERKIMEFKTSFATSAEGRVYNVTAAAKTLNNTILKPGDVFDYGKIIAATEKKYGFREAPVIFQGKLIPGIGGGICQVSSTLYNAVIRTGLQIVERRNHSLPVSYLPIGQDATFSEGNINFRFKNTTGKTLIIRAEAVNKELTVKLFGTMDKNTRYDISSSTVKVLEPPIKYVVDTNLPEGGQEILSEGKQGYIVETYQTLTKNGKVIEKKRISRDTYMPQPMLVAVNNGGEVANPKSNEDTKEILEDGIS